jgi:hypothetical protein
MKYEDYIEGKRSHGEDHGFKPLYMNKNLFDFQAFIATRAVERGRMLIGADCGLGKTLIGLNTAQNFVMKTNKPTLYLTPLAVAYQTEKESVKFGIETKISRDGKVNSDIVITNYEKLHLFNSSDFGGIICDESSILKSFDGQRKQEITEFMRNIPYRSLQTATAAPNDYIELGTSSEALGYLGYMDFLNKFFKNQMNNSATGRNRGEIAKYRLRGHAELPFWRYITSWSIACRKPSDVGFDDGLFILPKLIEQQTVVKTNTKREGFLFDVPAIGLQEQREETRRTITERCEAAADIANKTGEPVLVWCQLNDEGDLLEKLIPDCVQVSGKDSDDSKEEKLLSFASGESRVLVTKPKIGAWGLNFQHCNKMTFFPSHSYEQYYQCVRRCWRFGQKREGECDVIKNMKRKSEQADIMFENLVKEMNNSQNVVMNRVHDKVMNMPSWI